MGSWLCWLLGHDPQPKWDANADPWCGRCERYVPSDKSRQPPIWERVF